MWKWIVGSIVGIAILSSPFWIYGIALKNSTHYETMTIKRLEPSTDHNPYRVYTTDGATRSVEDSLWFWNFRASDRYGKLDVGHTYRCKVAGWRLGFISAYPNLLDCKEV